MKEHAEAINRVLVPFERDEAMSMAQAAKRAGKSLSTLRLWCQEHPIGRRVGGGTWSISRPALAMLLDGNVLALEAYALGERHADPVSGYFEREGLGHLLKKWAPSSQPSQSSQSFRSRPIGQRLPLGQQTTEVAA